MPKSRHRKNHKKKVAAYKQKKQEKKNSLYKKFREQMENGIQSDVNQINPEENQEVNG